MDAPLSPGCQPMAEARSKCGGDSSGEYLVQSNPAGSIPSSRETIHLHHIPNQRFRISSLAFWTIWKGYYGFGIVSKQFTMSFSLHAGITFR